MLAQKRSFKRCAILGLCGLVAAVAAFGSLMVPGMCRYLHGLPVHSVSPGCDCPDGQGCTCRDSPDMGGDSPSDAGMDSGFSPATPVEPDGGTGDATPHVPDSDNATVIYGKG